MTAIVFLGPTLPRAEAAAVLDAVYMPPAAQGDVYRAALKRPRAIGIVDGYFESVPAVWHKEILWALSEGILVFGAASIGALRAAELAPYGMQGVGEIFQAFQQGRVEQDDEVAVLHGPAEAGYVALSEAMANIRATLARATAEGVLPAALSDALLAQAKGTFYKERTWPDLLSAARAGGVDGTTLDRFSAWLPAGRVDRKRLDAVAMLQRLSDCLRQGHRPPPPAWHFHATQAWNKAKRLAEAAAPLPGEADDVSADLLLEELALDGDAWRAASRAALLRLLADAEGRRLGYRSGSEQLQEAVAAFRATRGLHTDEDFGAWLARNDLADDDLIRLLQTEARLDWVRTATRGVLRRHILDHLRLTGLYGRLAERASRKLEALAASGLEPSSPVDSGLSEEQLLTWFDARSRRRPATQLVGTSFDSRADLLRALAREYRYVVAEPSGENDIRRP